MKKLLYIIPLFIFSFTFTGGPSGGWYQQFLPDIGGRQIADITFTDSLTGYIVTTRLSTTDTSLILKTTNGGDNWTFIHSDSGYIYKRIQFINQNTGYVGGTHLIKTTNGGDNWFTISSFLFMQDINVLNEDTMWYVDPNGLTGGVFRTTNGGVNWTNQLNLGSLNPTHIYFYNNDTGFIASTVLYKTTNSGVNWVHISGGTGFGEMYFMNSTTGWKCYGPIQKTTDGGLNWQTLPLPSKGGNIILSRVNNMHVLNEDTIWGAGSVGIVNSLARGLIYITTDGGNTWGYQVADTSANIFQYYYIQFTDKNKGWSYGVYSGVHTITGGDTTIIPSVQQISNEIPTEFTLCQNYPNPFNPVTNMVYELRIKSNVRLEIYDLTGKLIQTLVDREQPAGTYKYTFDGNRLTSGVYFYKLQTQNFTDTKKMLLVK